MSAYFDALEVEGGDFILDAERLIVRDREVTFMLSGSDQQGAQGQALAQCTLMVAVV